MLRVQDVGLRRVVVASQCVVTFNCFEGVLCSSHGLYYGVPIRPSRLRATGRSRSLVRLFDVRRDGVFLCVSTTFRPFRPFGSED